MEIETIEMARHTVNKIEEKGQVSFIRILTGEALMDAHNPCRNSTYMCLIEYRYRGESADSNFMIVNTPDLPTSIGGFLVSTTSVRSLKPYYLAGTVNGINRLLFPLTASCATWAIRLGTLRIDTGRSIPVIPQAPTAPQIPMCATVGIDLYKEHVGVDGKRCPYSGTVTGRPYDSRPCPRCGANEMNKARDATTFSGAGDSALAILKREGVIWW